MGHLIIRPRRTPRAPVHTCALPEPQFLEVHRPDLSTATAAVITEVHELVPFGEWSPETILHHCERMKAGGAIGYRANEYKLDGGRVFQTWTHKTNRDR